MEAAPGRKELAQKHGVSVTEVRPLHIAAALFVLLAASAAVPGHMLNVRQQLCLRPTSEPLQVQLGIASHDSSPPGRLSQPCLLQWLLSNWTAAMLELAYENISEHKDLSRRQEHLKWQAILNLLISLQRELPGVPFAAAMLWYWETSLHL